MKETSRFLPFLPNFSSFFPIPPGFFQVFPDTGMLKGFEVHFRKFWYIGGWVIVTYPMHPICKIGCNLAKKAPNLPQIGCFLQKNGIEMGHKIMLFEV